MRIGKYEMESPLMNAGGVVKTVEDVRQMARTGVGAVLAGSYTLDPRAGNSPNSEVVYYHDQITGQTTNALGMPNEGLEVTSKDIADMIKITHDHGKPFVLNLAPTSTDPVKEVIRMSEVLERAGIGELGLDAIELNASCPNVVTKDGGRHAILSHNPDLLADVLSKLRDVSANKLPFEDLIVRISPLLKESDALQLVESLKESSIDAVAAFNTFPGGKPVDEDGKPKLDVPGGIGGRSGSAMQAEAERQTAWLARAKSDLNAQFEIIGSNGIHDAISMKRRLDLGASAVSATTLFWEAQSWGSAVDILLNEYAQLTER